MPLELWAGVEATVNRVGEDFLDQSRLSGFHERVEDLDRLASLGAKRVRFPVLWERIAPETPDEFDWRWTDGRLARLRELGLAPIVGLLHHGSGPKYTNLLDPEFPEKLARYAGAVAARYPWAGDYTPVNEPVTTARFSGLYGHWYPHHASDSSFVRALLNQVRGTVLAMRAIREVNPAARLVQTEDLGFTHATPRLQYQADFDNDRRWLSFDLLTGKVDGRHPLWGYLLWAGATEAELRELRERPCPPDILGINTYATSERFLDHRLNRYPVSLHVGNGRDAFVDVEAVRVLGGGVGGFAARLREASARYRLPLAITEVHLGCTREEQVRWLAESWEAAREARHDGADVRAVTVWAAFGAHEWNSLLTRREGHYESGLWDVRAPEPRETALAGVARQLARDEAPSHPVLGAPGWWHREGRLLHPPHGRVRAKSAQGRPILISGANGTLGQALARVCDVRGLSYRLANRVEMDIADSDSVRSALTRWRPWAVINATGYVRVDDAERGGRNWRENALGPAVLARACADLGTRLVTFSSDLVFDGAKREPYVESDRPNPLSACGHAKREGEERTLEAFPRALVVRTSAFFGPWDEHNFAVHVLRALEERRPFQAASDQIISPTYVPDLAHACLDLLIDGEEGIWHLANEGALSWADFARMVADFAHLDAGLIEDVNGADFHLPALRPAYSALGSGRGWIMPSLEQGLACFFRDARQHDVLRDLVGGAAD